MQESTGFKRSRARAPALLVALILPYTVVNASIDDNLATLVDITELGDAYAAIDESHRAAPTDALPSLGRALFFSTQLSGDRDVACVSCHHPLLGGSDQLSLPVGIGAHLPEVVGPGRVSDISRDRDPKAARIGGPNVRRNSLTTFNAGLFKHALLFDGRIHVLPGTDDLGQPRFRTPESTLRTNPDQNAVGDLLAVQARFPTVSFQEMRGFGEFYELTSAEVRQRIAERLRSKKGWVKAFRSAFGESPMAAPETFVTYDNIARALSAYQRTQTFIDSAWRDYAGGNEGALSENAKRGARLFFADAPQGGLGCASCHSGPLLSDESFHVVGFPQLGRGKRADGDDPGAYLVSQDDDDKYRFRTPSLLNVEVTPPYGHAGAFENLQALLRYHADPATQFETFDFSLSRLRQLAGKPDAYPTARELTGRAIDRLSPLLPHRALTDAEIDALVAFLTALTDPCVRSRDCLQPWIASYRDDFDGHLLQPVFDISTASLPFDIASEAAVAPGMLERATTVPPLPAGQLEELLECHDHTPERPSSGRSRFVDRTVALGLEHTHFIPPEMWYGSASSFQVEFAMSSGPLVSGDINGDCRPDLVFGTYVGNGPALLAYLSTDDGFKRESLDLSGLPDMIGALGLADLDADYRLDLAVGNLFGARETALYGNAGTDADFELRQKISMSKSVFGFAFGDYSGDGWLDLFAAHWDNEARPAQAPALMRNAGGVMRAADDVAGTTGADLEQNFHFSPAFADFDADGDQDIVIASDFGTSEVLLNDGNGVFAVTTDHAVITDENGMGQAIADFDNDGLLDWFVTAIYKEDDGVMLSWGDSGNRLYRGTGDGLTFTDATESSGLRDGGWGWGACAADFNNDGWIDIFHENGFGSLPDEVVPLVPEIIVELTQNQLAQFLRIRPRLFLNRGDGTFDEVGEAWGLDERTNGRGIVCIDYDRDGDIDVVTVQNSSTPRFYENTFRGSDADGFVGFHLIGTQPNTGAIGATVTVEVNGQRQMRPVLANSNFQGQNPSTLHFGLGDAEVIDEVSIRWPDGTLQSLENVAGGKYYSMPHPDLRNNSRVAATGR